MLDVVLLGDALVGFSPEGHLRFAYITRAEVEELLASGDQENQR